MQDLDTAIFRLPSQTAQGDRKSLLAIQHIVRAHLDRYVYLEIGSHMGGTLVPHLMDDACRLIYSVDKRPVSQLDERGVFYDYTTNSTQRMIEALRPAVQESALLKLITIDNDISDVMDSDIARKVDLIFIDGEHTNIAAFRDFVRSLRFMNQSFIAAFHDAHLVCDALLNIEQLLTHQQVPFRSHFLPNYVFVVCAGEFARLADQPLQRMAFDRQTFIEHSRIARWKNIAANAALIEGDTVGHIRAA
jgi:hypothetical protein